ncbi:4Fe-4S binding protein [Barnesiella sp. An22]|uniref:4Fe-4S binding protein n=1 Tax=Barnesiella sp. An22 TaxID=1965590 RepID=UPI000B37BBBA|nr:4Fe-4S binding protein [Barnesiella sp. An22]OUO96092.1 ferredoxin [Barnesiella sp. An22]
MLRKIRIVAATICFALITLLFLDVTGTLHLWFGWLARIQFLPAVLALNVGVILLLVVLTLLFGRIYCSVICPLGVFQDIVSWLAGKRKKHRFRYSPALSWLRYGVLIIFIAAIVAGFTAWAALIAPYSAYGRIATNLFAPIYRWGNNLLALVAERMDSYAFYSTEVWLKSLPSLIVAAVTLVVIVVLAWRNGRTYCNTICPVGTTLGLLSRFSFFRPAIDTTKCNGCQSCARNCKASCIDAKNHAIDYSRCVVCMDCLNRCTQHAIHYVPRTRLPKNKKTAEAKAPAPEAKGNNSRREFLTLTGVLAGSALLKAQEMKVDGGLAAIEEKKIPKRATPITPPGSLSASHLAQHCTACQLCITNCPNQVLRPSGNLITFMQPEMSYERGYCRPECTRCSEVCPTGAIRPITVAEKSSIQIGHAVWVKANCIPLTDGVSCGNCARHCPVGAIQMVASDPAVADSPKIPVVNTERCIGCGTCENLCPARPFSAIYVEGHKQHRII